MSFLKKKSLVTAAAIGVGCALGATALLLLPVAWAVAGGMLSEQTGSVCACAVAGLGVLLPTAVIARARGREALATGGAVALGVIALGALGCALGGTKCAFGPWLIWLTAAALAGGIAGSLVSVRQNRQKRRRR